LAASLGSKDQPRRRQERPLPSIADVCGVYSKAIGVKRLFPLGLVRNTVQNSSMNSRANSAAFTAMSPSSRSDIDAQVDALGFAAAAISQMPASSLGR
jgi:hypothetical protein